MRVLSSDSRSSRVHQLDVILEVRGDGIFQCADGRLPALDVREVAKVGVEELTGLADRDGELDPFSCGRHSGSSDIMLGKPGANGIDTLGRWR